ncbi:Adenosine/AMP deaminase domain-containing protein [Cardiosporidium cionae]|uniref:Adenosine/AMP deaminase domain-containing protein n=1 Tax=Cardiosporidium cionae TaxID=476202 RepID=A0ABQ7JDY7_9APIC|nr:Adenosine/AMP deaminase domain-containing protein [Cardiosporidium cionae]|eukprot:KAF8821860.1 Adenosine/AMP deaminase domain-containing protein [Cardiosporidium cionae]
MRMPEAANDRMRKQVLDLKKVELHAHLFGSIRRATLIKLKETAKKRAVTQADSTNNDAANYLEQIQNCNRESGSNSTQVADLNSKFDSLDSAFQYFKLVYELVDNSAIISTILEEVLYDFHKDSVVYLELRTTLKNIPQADITHESYAALLVAAIKKAESNYDMTVSFLLAVRLLLSIDRQKVIDEGSAQKELDDVLRIAELYNDYVVGIDIAGNPKKGNLLHLLPLIQSSILDPYSHFYRKLKVTIHTAEVENAEETNAILLLLPHRLGHACFLTKEQREFVCEHSIPVELCPTSNVAMMELETIKDHHFGLYFYDQNYTSLCICTDDIGLFETSLTEELLKIADAFQLSIKNLKDLQIESMRAAFCQDTVKQKILKTHFT